MKIEFDENGNLTEKQLCKCGQSANVYLSGESNNFWMCEKCAYGEKENSEIESVKKDKVPIKGAIRTYEPLILNDKWVINLREEE